MIRWSVQKGFITIPKSSKTERITENADVFDWSIADADMTILVRQKNILRKKLKDIDHIQI